MRRQEGRNPSPAAATPGWCAAADTPAASAACAAKAVRDGCCARGSGAGASQGTGRGGCSARRGIPRPHDAGHAAAVQCEGARGAAAVLTGDAADRGRLGNPARHRREAAIFAAARARAARAPARGRSTLGRGGLALSRLAERRPRPAAARGGGAGVAREERVLASQTSSLERRRARRPPRPSSRAAAPAALRSMERRGVRVGE